MFKRNEKKEKINYFQAFTEQIDFALRAATLFKEFTDNFDKSKSKEYEIKIHRLETQADSLQHHVLNNLIKDFIPPIDREDIVALSHKIDDLTDNIDKCVLNLDILNITSLRPDFVDFTDLLLNCCSSTKEIISNMKNIKQYDKIKKIIIEVNKLEQKGDNIYRKALKELYSTPQNPLEVMSYTRLYDCLEECFDTCEHIADFVNEILLKNS